MKQSRYTIWDDDQECWVIYKNGKFIGGDAINALGELEETGATPFDIRKMQRIAKIADEHGGIYHLQGLDEAAMDDRLLILPEGYSVTSTLKPLIQLYAPDLYEVLWGQFETPQEKAQMKIIKEVEADEDAELDKINESPQGQPKGKKGDWRNPIDAFDGW